MRCIIVDDEPLAQDVLENFVEKVPDLIMVAKCSNAFEAESVIREGGIDLMFLDIEMPDIKGTDFLQNLISKPFVIFTTAYPEYALKGFELDAVDYLLKPISPERFLRAVSKVRTLIQAQSKGKEVVHSDDPVANDFIFVKADYQTIKVKFNDITYIEGLKDYVKIYTMQGIVVPLMNLKTMQEKLPQQMFIRIHRSYIVSVDAIERIERGRVIVGDKRIPIGESYKEQVDRLIK